MESLTASRLPSFGQSSLNSTARATPLCLMISGEAPFFVTSTYRGPMQYTLIFLSRPVLAGGTSLQTPSKVRIGESVLHVDASYLISTVHESMLYPVPGQA